MKKIITLILISIAISFASFGNSKDYYINKGTEYIIQVNKKIANYTAKEISSILWEQALKHNIDYHFVLGIITTESRFNINAKSYCGAIGLMQIMPKTAKYIANKYNIEYNENLYDIKTNIKIGVAYLSYLKKKFNNYELVAAGYNSGTVGAIRYKEYLFGKRKQNEISSQTLAYVPKVMGYTLDFKKTTKYE